MLRQRQLLHTHYYTHTSMAGEIYLVFRAGEPIICSKQKIKPYLPNSSNGLFEFMPRFEGV